MPHLGQRLVHAPEQVAVEVLVREEVELLHDEGRSSQLVGIAVYSVVSALGDLRALELIEQLVDLDASVIDDLVAQPVESLIAVECFVSPRAHQDTPLPALLAGMYRVIVKLIWKGRLRLRKRKLILRPLPPVSSAMNLNCLVEALIAAGSRLL